MVSQIFCKAHLLVVSLTKIPEDHENRILSPPCRTPCKLFIHEVFFGPFTFVCEVNLDGLRPFDQQSS